MNDVIPGIRVLGRRFKPVALGVTIIMIGLTIAGLFRWGTFEDYNPFFLILQIAASAVSAGLLIYGWFADRERWAEWGLLIGTFAYLERAVLLTFVDTFGDSVLLAYGVLVIIAGSYFLEASDNRREGD